MCVGTKRASIVLLALAAVASHSWAQNDADAVLADPNAIRVLLSAQTETTLVAQMMGQIATLNASLGATVKKGQTLVGFDCAEAQARLKMAQAERDSAKETLSVKDNLRKLDAAGDLEVSLARTELRRSEAAVAMSTAQMAHCTVLAPFDGRVVKTHVKPYQGVNVGAPLVELVSSGALKIRLNVPSRLLSEINPGTPFSVEIDETGRSYSAKVTAINGRVDAVAQTIELEGRLDEVSAELLPGMSGVARFVADTPASL
ncbi:efflux RND transporter periplasmic adaptor subunit [Ectopseudomonas mendocina]|uniref:Efflux RND transporter periplasmic adaptor subunit n=1 Tax=Ectopseudomonas mendocina TaxID=300 RepID=A0ABZ2RLG5_ECTME